MAIAITLYNFSKRENSTKQPNIEGVEIECYLKENTSKYTPSFEIFNINMTNYSYVKWENRYYYITDSVSIGNEQWSVVCSIDSLATYKNEIGKVSCYQTYSTLGYDTGITDIRLSTNKNATKKTNVYSAFKSGGGYVVNTIGQSLFSTAFIPSHADFYNLTQKLVDDDLMTSLLVNADDYLSKKINNASDCIVSAIYIPITPDTSFGFDIILGGGYNTGIKGYSISHETTFDVTVTIPWQFDDFRNRSQFTSILLYLPAYGTVTLNADDFNGVNTIDIHVSFDPYNGDICYRVGTYARYLCSVGVPQPVGTVSTGNLSSMLSNGAGAIIGLATQNYALTGMSLFNTVLSSMERSVGSTGSNGGASSWNVYKQIAVTTICHNTSVEPSTLASEYGRPVNAVKKVTNGFNQCVNADVEIATSKDILQEVNSYMNGGFYYE